MRLFEANDLTDIDYAETYAGGASIALALLLQEYASTIHINDLNRAVYAFWYLVLNDCDALCRRIERVRVSMAEWRRQRAIYEERDTAALDDLGFAAFFLNRTNRSGIIHSGGMIGGNDQTGNWKIDARYNKVELIARIERIADYSNAIEWASDHDFWKDWLTVDYVAKKYPKLMADYVKDGGKISDVLSAEEEEWYGDQ